MRCLQFINSMLAIAWSELQEWEQVENYTSIANEDHHPPFYVLNELPESVGGGCDNFITGAGSLLQVLLNGIQASSFPSVLSYHQPNTHCNRICWNENE